LEGDGMDLGGGGVLLGPSLGGLFYGALSHVEGVLDGLGFGVWRCAMCGPGVVGGFRGVRQKVQSSRLLFQGFAVGASHER
jgi:hypothetical protein